MNSQSIKVLLIEDNPGDCRLIQEMLLEADVPSFGFELDYADRLSKALDHLGKKDVDIILSDLSLPDSQGFETFNRLHVHASKVPIVVLTGTFDDEWLGIEAVKKGAQDYLVKQQVNSNLLRRSICYAIERKRLEETIRRMAYHDPLTNLPNRALFSDRLTLAIARTRRNKETLAVLFLDLDEFKHVNDTLGHTMGDQLLKVMAARLAGCVRACDTVARFGGDEFTLLLSGINRPENTANVADKILESVRQPLKLESHEVNVTASIGIALCPGDGGDVETLLKNADIAMYRAKGCGKDNYQFYSPP